MRLPIKKDWFSIRMRGGGNRWPGKPLGAPASSLDLIDHSRGNNRDKSAKTSPQHTPVSANIRVTIYLIILIMWSGESLCFHTSMTTPEWVYDLLRLRGHYNYYDTGWYNWGTVCYKQKNHFFSNTAQSTQQPKAIVSQGMHLINTEKFVS